MDKDLVERVRQSLASMSDTLQEINDYLAQLRKQTDEEIANLARRVSMAAQAAARVNPDQAYTGANPSPRYTGGRQPRRDGDSFGRVPRIPDDGGAHAKRKEGDD